MWEKKTANLHIRWEPSSHAEFERHAERRDMTAAHLARRILRAWLKTQGNHAGTMVPEMSAA
jgi:hypothetical protein